MSETEWSIGDPTEIHDNWYENKKGCQGCPHRDDDLRTAPFYGYATSPDDYRDSEVILLGEAPGGNDMGEINLKRTSKNTSDIQRGEDLEKASSARSIRNLRERVNKSDGSSFSQLGYLINQFVDREIDVYWTQVKKCNDVWAESGEFKSDFAEARDQCSNYLGSEISQIDPSAIIVLNSSVSNKSNAESDNVPYVLDRFGIEYGKTSPKKHYIQDSSDSKYGIQTYGWNNITVIPSYHYVQAQGTASNVWEESDLGYSSKDYDFDDGGWKESYWDEIVRLVESSI